MHPIGAQFPLGSIGVRCICVLAHKLLGLVGNADQVLALTWVCFHAWLRIALHIVGEADSFVAILESCVGIVVKARELEGHPHVCRDQKIGVPRAQGIIGDNLPVISHTPIWAHRLSPWGGAVATANNASRPGVDPVDNGTVRPLRDVLRAGDIFEHHLPKRGLGDPGGLAGHFHLRLAQEEQLISTGDVGNQRDKQAHENDHAHGLNGDHFATILLDLFLLSLGA
mmetsp:Transcript_50999/g.116101  ORF Transcript_50999/g.116101 Transcript_50999/m.116101 type:complete len:226 (+) Transcript_50999:2557-3234(+)